MKKLLLTIFISFFLSGNVYAEVLVLSCKENDSTNEAAEWIFDLKKKTYTTVFGAEIDIASTEEGIFFHTYMKNALVTTFHVSRLTGKATIKRFIYNDEFKKKVRENLPVETNKLKSEYPKHTDDDLFILAMNNVTFNYPANTSTMDCSKLTKKF
jgi:hypothetical protein